MSFLSFMSFSNRGHADSSDFLKLSFPFPALLCSSVWEFDFDCSIPVAWGHVKSHMIYVQHFESAKADWLTNISKWAFREVPHFTLEKYKESLPERISTYQGSSFGSLYGMCWKKEVFW